MATLKTALKNWLRDAKRIALLGVGSELRGDDAAGILVVGEVKKNLSKVSGTRKFRAFDGATAPENLTGEIKRFKPTHLAIIDSADIGKKAGEIILLKPQMARGVSFCTHQLPLKILVDYLMDSIDCRVMIIGVQPKRLDFGSLPSKEIQKSVKIIADTFKEIVSR